MTFLEFSKNIEKLAQECPGNVHVSFEMDGQIFEIASEQSCQSASLIKIPILIAALKEAEYGFLSLEEKIVVTADDKIGGAGVLQTLSDGVQLKVQDLLALMVIVSDNTATNMIIDLIGMQVINQRIFELGLKQTKLSRKMMDFEAIEAGQNNFTSAKDIIGCLKAVNEGGFLQKPLQSVFLNILHNQQFVDKLPAMMDLERVKVANKTGELPGVEHDCAIIQFHEKTAYGAVMIDNLVENNGGRLTIRSIGEVIYDYIIS